MNEMHRSERSSVASANIARGGQDRRRRGAGFNVRARLLTGLALVAGLVTYGVGIPAARAATSTVRITLGGGTDFTDASIYYADNLLKKEGVNVQLSNLADPASALQAVVSGSSDIYLGDPMEAAVAVANGGANIRYIATVAQTTDYVILSLPQFTLSASSLSGATMGSAGPGTAGTIIANAALQKAGIDPSTIHAVTVGGTSARITAILSGQVDLAPALAPSAVPAVETGKVKILLNAGTEIGKYLQQGLIASNSFIKAHPKLVQQVVNAYLDANRWASKNENGFISVANANQLQGSLTASQQQASWVQLQQSHFYAVNGAVCPNAINKTERYTWAAGGSLTQANTPSFYKWVNRSFVQAYLKKHHQKRGSC
jgi:NitT/TauT family transport system substrate-binding protein